MSGTYPDDWKDISLRVKDDNLWLCERCKHGNDYMTGHVLTVHHLDGNKSNCERWNLAALCQRCHLSIQSRVHMGQGILFPDRVADWFVPHLKGYLEWLTTQEEVATSLEPSAPANTLLPEDSSPSPTKMDQRPSIETDKPSPADSSTLPNVAGRDSWPA